MLSLHMVTPEKLMRADAQSILNNLNPASIAMETRKVPMKTTAARAVEFRPA